MIWESYYWKNDLLKIGKRLRKRIIQKKWFDASFANTEKDIMLSAFMIRKLFDSKKIDLRIEKNRIFSTYYKSNGKKINWMKNLFPERYFDLENPIEDKIEVRDLCNQIIHSYLFHLIINENNTFESFWFTSDLNKIRQMVQVQVTDYIELIERIGNYWPESESYMFNSKKGEYDVFHNLTEKEIDKIRLKNFKNINEH